MNVMIWDVPHTLAVIAIALIAAVLGPRIFRAARRFDAENQKRMARDAADRHDRDAHIRHTLEIAEEQVENVQTLMGNDPRTGTPVAYYVFEGERFSSREAAEAVRAQRIYEIARGFYADLPRALTRRAQDNLRQR